MNPRGRTVWGQLDASNLVDLEMRLKRMDMDFINGAPVRRRTWIRSTRVPRREIIEFCFHLEQMIRAGVPIIEALADLRDSTEHPHFRQVTASIIESIEGGRTLSQALLEHPGVFSHVMCNLVRAGEASGRLPEVLSSLVESLKWEDELASHARKIVIYPALVASVVLGVTIFLLIYLVPQMAAFIRSMGHELPLHTRLLIGVSDFVVNFWYLLLAVGVIGVLGLRHLVRTSPEWRLRVDEWKLRLPLVGNVLRKIILARFAGVFAMMYASGIAIIDAVRATEDVVGNAAIRDGLKRVGQLISEGQNLTTAFQRVGLFPPLVLRMLRVGENTGKLDTALANVSYFYNRDVRESIQKAQTVIEPALTVVLGMLLLWVMMAVLGPVYDIITKLKI